MRSSEVSAVRAYIATVFGSEMDESQEARSVWHDAFSHIDAAYALSAVRWYAERNDFPPNPFKLARIAERFAALDSDDSDARMTAMVELDEEGRP